MVVIDIETTGVNPATGAIVDIAAHDFNNPDNAFVMQCRPWDGAILEPESLAYNGFVWEELIDSSRPSQREMLEAFVAWITKIPHQTLAVHNTHFDLYFLRFALDRKKIFYRASDRIIDQHTIIYYSRPLTPPPPTSNKK